MLFEKLQSLKGKVVRHYTHTDADGRAPEICSELSELEVIEYNPLDYKNFDEEMLQAITFIKHVQGKGNLNDSLAILITDIAPTSKEVVEGLNDLYQMGITVVLIDHHDTSKWIMEEYPQWSFIVSEIDGKKTAATQLYYYYLLEKGLLEEDVAKSLYLESFVEQIRLYDTWDWTRVKENPCGLDFPKHLSNLLYIVGPELWVSKQISKIKANILHHSPDTLRHFTFDETEELLVGIESKKEKYYIEGRAKTLMKRRWEVAGKGYNVGVVFADNYHSVLGNDLAKLNKDLDFIAIIDMNKGKGSLRSIHKDIHVGEIARAMIGGGGHPAAAGFEFSTKDSLVEIEASFGAFGTSLI